MVVHPGRRPMGGRLRQGQQLYRLPGPDPAGWDDGEVLGQGQATQHRRPAEQRRASGRHWNRTRGVLTSLQILQQAADHGRSRGRAGQRLGDRFEQGEQTGHGGQRIARQSDHRAAVGRSESSWG